MSSTLFGRGTNTQVGGKKRAEDQERAVTAVRASIDEVKAATAVDVRALTARITTLETSLTALQKTVTELKASVSSSTSSSSSVATTEA
jgi:hypothetical protein